MRERAHACAWGRHTDATLRAAVALWFRNKAAAVAQYGPIGDWDTRDVKDMGGLFKYKDFDEDIGRWNVGGVEDMNYMFGNAASFNQPLDKWDVSSVKNMYMMFCGAASFNQPLDKWDVSSVKDMSHMFCGAASFNQPLDKWDVSSVKHMYGMFCGAASFNQPLDKWDVSSVDGNMFEGAASFNQPATLKRFGLVLPSPIPRAHRHALACRPTVSAVSTVSPRAHLQRMRARTAVLCYTRVCFAPVARTLTFKKCIHAQPTATEQAEACA
jgi:surface protein